MLAPVDLDLEASDDFWGERATGEPCREAGLSFLLDYLAHLFASLPHTPERFPRCGIAKLQIGASAAEKEPTRGGEALSSGEQRASILAQARLQGGRHRPLGSSRYLNLHSN